MQEKKKSAKKVIREIKRNTRRKFSAEEKIRIVLEGKPQRDRSATYNLPDLSRLRTKAGFAFLNL